MLGNEKKWKKHNLLMLWILKKIPYVMHLFINNKCYPFWKAMLNISNFLCDLSVSWRHLKDNIFKSSLIIFPFKYVCISHYSLLLKKKYTNQWGHRSDHQKSFRFSSAGSEFRCWNDIITDGPTLSSSDVHPFLW